MFMEIQKPEYEQLPFLLTTVGSQQKQTTVSRPGGCAFHQFLYVTQGKGVCTLADGRRVVLSAHTGFLIRQGVPVNYEPVGETFATAWLTFRGSGAEALLAYYDIEDSLFFEVTDNMIDGLKTLEESVRRKTITARSAEGYAFVLGLLDQLTQPAGSWAGKVACINHYLESRYAEPVTLDDVAACVSSDRFSVCQQYRKWTGETVMSHLRSIRMAQAKELLRQQYSAQEVCRLCGFDSPSYFGKLFREETGLTPGQFRARYR